MVIPGRTVSEEDVARHYDELDHFYLKIWGEHVHHGLWVEGHESPETAVQQLVDLVAAEADLRPGDHVCDVGAGYGAASRQLVNDYGARVTALTISRLQHEYARQMPANGDNPRYILADWLRNDLPSDHFDAVVAIESASHMADSERFTSESARVLKPGGRLVVCAWVAREHASTRERKHLLEPICREGRLAHLLTATEYLSLLEKAGLSLTNFEDLSNNVRKTWSICLRRAFARLLAHPGEMKHLMSPGDTHRVFLRAMMRIFAAYRTGAIRYGLFRAVKPLTKPSAGNGRAASPTAH